MQWWLAEGFMGRIFGFVGLVMVLGVGLYLATQQMKTATAVGGADTPTGAVNLTGVKGDLLGLAQAERTYFAQEGKYGSLDDLVNGNYVTVKRQRPPFSYEISTTASGFQVTATRSGPGSPAKMWVDETMQVQSGD
jgi:hypothetical protein